ncbi:DUF2341 domain-containing protein [Lignipirellula cremea]|uniref:DUF2341 domain-containing protein n=1 Tax=Lignipirellula cremea TaxID=2528010 RepID=A0A518DL82_9BACT|nr:DUF2341 domain-containing protein [Lignipirellula cremea]QDU92594.1 hypothetical protein Pla8534_03420 [Lignipirellula cremea]
MPFVFPAVGRRVRVACLPVCLAILLALSAVPAFAEYEGWKHKGSLFLLTTPEGSNLPAGAKVENFPLLVRLHRDGFDFRQAKPDGADVRFSTPAGEPLAFQIEQWDAAAGVASIWVRIPVIEGNARQEIRLHWGNADAASASDGAAVFNASNGYLGVWHMDSAVTDAVGAIESQNTGVEPTTGVIGQAARFPGGKGIFGGDQIDSLPVGSAPHSTQAWFRPRQANGIVIGWGNEKGQGKIVVGYRSPPHVRVDGYFSDANVNGQTPLQSGEWTHVVHTYQQGEARLYINGQLDTESKTRATPLSIQSPARLWIGGWYNNYSFVGDIDETRVSRTVRSADWVRLEYENQKPLQTLVGQIVPPGTRLAMAESKRTVAEGQSLTLQAEAGGAQKLYWIRQQDGQETVLAVDQRSLSFDAGRVQGDQSLTLQLKAIYPDEVRTIDLPLVITEAIPEPIVTLKAPADWDGRQTIEVVAQVGNLPAMQAAGAGELSYHWDVAGLATIRETAPGKLLLQRAQNSGRLTITAHVSNGGKEVSATTQIQVQEPAKDAWVERSPDPDEKPVDNQFYARDEKNLGTLYCNGTLDPRADATFLKVYAEDELYQSLRQPVAADGKYAFTAKLEPGLVHYRVEFGSTTGGVDKVLHTAGNLVCGDAFLIIGQSNALATDTREQAPAETHDWIRSYGKPTRGDTDENLWCNPVWKARQGEKAELGYWGMELAKRLLASQQMPICIINGAVGGTRIDQHQRNESDPTDLATIYGRLLWRVQKARLTHGVKAILWHQGESDQGADGPDGGYGWETYREYFVQMSGGWKRDFPNVQHYYLFQIWPNACSMGNGHGDMLREVQRTLPDWYSQMEILSTLGVNPAGPCHYPLTGWAEFARLIQPLLERDCYGKKIAGPLTPANLRQARFANADRQAIVLEFDQPVAWDDTLLGQFYLGEANEPFVSAVASGNALTLQLKEPAVADRITYLQEKNWRPQQVLRGQNGLAALSFCEVMIEPAESAK